MKLFGWFDRPLLWKLVCRRRCVCGGFIFEPPVCLLYTRGSHAVPSLGKRPPWRSYREVFWRWPPAGRHGRCWVCYSCVFIIPTRFCWLKPLHPSHTACAGLIFPGGNCDGGIRAEGCGEQFLMQAVGVSGDTGRGKCGDYFASGGPDPGGALPGVHQKLPAVPLSPLLGDTSMKHYTRGSLCSVSTSISLTGGTGGQGDSTILHWLPLLAKNCIL